MGTGSTVVASGEGEVTVSVLMSQSVSGTYLLSGWAAPQGTPSYGNHLDQVTVDVTAAVNPGLCSDVDECSIGVDNCDTNAACTNTPGSYTCACNTGYTGNGVICTGADATEGSVAFACTSSWAKEVPAEAGDSFDVTVSYSVNGNAKLIVDVLDEANQYAKYGADPCMVCVWCGF